MAIRRVMAWLSACGALSIATFARADDDALLERVRASAAERGAEGAALLERHGQLKDKLLSAEAALAPGECVVAALTLSHGEAQLGLHTATVELVDHERGPVARVRYCAGEQEETAQWSIEGARGTEFALGLWRTHGVELVTAKPAAVVAASGTKTPSTTPAAAAPAAPLSERLATFANTAGKGLEVRAPAREEDLGERDPRVRDVVLEAGHCYRVLAAGEELVGHVDLSLQEPNGADVSADEKPSERGVALAQTGLFCPAMSGVRSLEVRVHGGSGRVLWQLYGKANPALTRRWPVGGEDQTLVAKSVRGAYDRVAPGQTAAMAFAHGQLKTAESADVPFWVSAGQCYTVIGAGVPSIRALELELYDPRGNLVAQGQGGGSLVEAKACADVGGAWTARVRAFKGYGEYGLQSFAAK